MTVYNGETAALFLNLTRPSLDSLDKGMRRNADGSVDIYFGPKAPAGQESNWIYTPAEKSWFPWFRFYGPDTGCADHEQSPPYQRTDAAEYYAKLINRNGRYRRFRHANSLSKRKPTVLNLMPPPRISLSLIRLVGFSSAVFYPTISDQAKLTAAEN